MSLFFVLFSILSTYCLGYELHFMFKEEESFIKSLRNRFKNATYLLGFYTMYTFVRTIQMNSSSVMEFTHLLSVVLIILVYGTFIY